MKNIQVFEKSGKEYGKTVVVLAGVHGNELCGISALEYFISKILINAGKVYFIYGNLEAIRQNKRYIEKNLNRCFLKKQPPDIACSLEGKTAQEIISFLDNADAMLDIHASFTKDSIPFVICDEKWIQEAGIFDAEIVSYNWDIFEPGSTDYYMNLQGKPGFCYECGYLGDRSTYEKAERAIEQFLIWAGCIKGSLKQKSNQKIVKIISIYKNTKSSFRKSCSFSDFTKLKERALIGVEGKEKIYGMKGDILIFVRDCNVLNEECFLIGREINQKVNKTLDSNKSKEKK